MELLQGLDLTTIGFVALISFGIVAIINFKWKLTSMQNFWLSVGCAFLLGFVPTDLGNMILTRLKDAIAIGLSLNGAYKALQGIAKKVGES